MKKISYLVMLLVTLSLPVAFVACGDDDPVENNGGGGGDKDDDGDDDDDVEVDTGVLPVAKQKQLLESTALELMGMVNANDFKAIADIANYMGELETDDRELDDWADACMDACETSVSDELVKRLWKASNFKGMFELKNNTWRLTGPNKDLQFWFPDANGQQCVLKLVYSGKETKVRHESLDSEDWDYVWTGNGGYEVVTRYENTFVIPENIIVTLTRNNELLAEVKTTVTLSVADASGEFNLQADKVNATAQVKVGDYEVVATKAAFTGGTTAAGQCAAKLVKAGRTLVSLKAEMDGDLSDVEYPVAGKMAMEFDVLGKVQLRGVIEDIDKVNKYLDKADDNYTNESVFKSNLENANSLMNIRLYFNGSNNSSAYFKYYPFEENDYYGKQWYYEAVVAFDEDGSSYSTMESYFDEIFFENVIDKFKQLGDDFAGLVDTDDEDTPLPHNNR